MPSRRQGRATDNRTPCLRWHRIHTFRLCQCCAQGTVPALISMNCSIEDRDLHTYLVSTTAAARKYYARSVLHFPERVEMGLRSLFKESLLEEVDGTVSIERKFLWLGDDGLMSRIAFFER
jgi:hypothetical protein